MAKQRTSASAALPGVKDADASDGPTSFSTEAAINVYRSLLHALPDAFIAIDDRRSIVEWSPRAEELFGWTATEVSRLSRDSLQLPPSYRESEHFELPFFIRKIDRHPPRSLAQFIAINAEGNEFPVEMSVTELPDSEPSKARHFLLIKDISHRILTEERIAQASKMEAIGQLVSGLAHDFNNALGIIQGSLETLAIRLTDPLDRELVQLAMTATERGTETTRAMQAVARRQPAQQESCNVNKVLLNIESLLHKSAGAGIELRLLAEAADADVVIDAGALNNVVLNFVINARDAMPTGGMILIYTQTIDIEDDPVEAVDLAPGRYVVLGVDDNGTGMAPEIASRAMEPFFTTKPHGKGTGLGLAMAYAFARQSGGALRIRSSPGKGTNIHLFIPATALPAESV